MKRRHWVSVLLVVIMISLMLVGCSGQAEPEPPTGSNEGDDKYGGTMILATGDLRQPNFIYLRDTPCGRLRDLVYDRLFAIDQDGQIIPRLATSYEALDGNKTYVVHLREDVKWHDGEAFTADDVVFYFDFYEKAVSTTKSVTYPFKVSKVDDYTVKFELDDPLISFIAGYGYTEYVALPEHIWKDVDPATFDQITDLKYFVGNGPFKITEMKTGDRITLERFDDYWEGKPYLDGVVLRVLTDADAIEAAFENGEINLHRVAQKTIDRLQGQAGFTFGSWGSGNMQLLLVNHYDPILSQLSVRKALSYCMNRQALMAAQQVKAEAMKSCFTSSDTFYNPNAADPEIAVYDIDKAIQVLEDDGWKLGSDGIRVKDGVRLSLALTATSANNPSYQIMIDDCKKAGIEFTIDVVDTATCNEKVFGAEPDFQLFWNGMTLGPSAYGYMNAYTNGSYYLRYDSPEVKALFLQAESSANLEEAQQYYDQIQQIVTADRAAVWLYSGLRNWGASSYLNTDDCDMNGLYCGWISIGKAYFEKP